MLRFLFACQLFPPVFEPDGLVNGEKHFFSFDFNNRINRL